MTTTEIDPSKYYVKNIGSKTYNEKFRGETITIEAGQSLEMARSKAVTFMGTAIPMTKDGGGQQVGGKTLQLVRPTVQLKARKIWISPKNGERYLSKEDMDLHDGTFEEIIVNEKVEESTTKEYVCLFCSESSDDKKAILHHMNMEHDDTNRNNKRRSKPV